MAVQNKGQSQALPHSLPRTGLRGICHAIIVIAEYLSHSFVQGLFQQIAHAKCGCHTPQVVVIELVLLNLHHP